MRLFTTALFLAQVMSACQVAVEPSAQPSPTNSSFSSTETPANPSSTASASSETTVSPSPIASARPSNLPASAKPSASPSATSEPTVSLDVDFGLKYRQPVKLGSENLELSFQDLLQDSRCPQDVMCGSAGDISVRFKLSQNGKELGQPELRLGQGNISAVVGNYRLTWVSVKPETLRSTEKVPASDYVLTVRVSKELGAVEAQLNQPFTLKLHQRAVFASEKIRLKYVALLEDSRCPADAQCIWAGQVRVQLEVTLDAEPPQKIELLWSLEDEKPSLALGKYILSLQSVGASHELSLLLHIPKS